MSDRELGRVVMVQGTASSVGKSILATALCRVFADDGLRVAPFKAQNMALNSFVTADGGEIGRAQAVQAAAAGVAPTVDMNPILLKPEAETRSQVVVMGQRRASMTALEYHAYKPTLREVVGASLERLRANHDIVVIEGAGSPAEINLKQHDIVNMHVAKRAAAPVLLVGDIDRGGVFAAFVGTMELLEPDERSLVAGYVINKFRGDLRLLDSGLEFLHRRTGVPVLGVVPHLPNLHIADEDSLSLDERRTVGGPLPDELHIAVVRLPRISNSDDVAALEYEPGVAVRFVDQPADITDADLVILPGSKATISDLAWLRETGLGAAIRRRVETQRPVLGICGGCQMLGHRIVDPGGVESDVADVAGLGLLPLTTRFGPDKTTRQVSAVASHASWMRPLDPDQLITGYEIHMGEVSRLDGATPAFRKVGCPEPGDGAVSHDGAVVGTMLHGILDNRGVRGRLLANLRQRRGWETAGASPNQADAFAKLAGAVRSALDMEHLRAIVGLPRACTTKQSGHA